MQTYKKEKEMENMIVVKDTEYLERCWQAETWKELAEVITNYTWIASDGNQKCDKYILIICIVEDTIIGIIEYGL